MKTRRSIIFRGAAILVFLILIAGAGVVFLEAGRCSDALFRCMGDPFLSSSLAAGAYCLNGYLFCIKYIER